MKDNHLYIPESCTNHKAIKPRNTTEFEYPTKPGTSDNGTGKDPDGETSELGPGASISSGLGGLGLEGIVGREDWDGTGAAPPGVGNRGVMSGERAGGEAMGGPGRTAGEAEMVEIGKLDLDSGKASEAENELPMTTITDSIANCGHMGAAINDDEMNECSLLGFGEMEMAMNKENESGDN
ncbi:uncharacterized protein LOC127786802 [Diospyros lotus]|uniref:uncharacterized protein LOC127786802 n=1 Tax=Diospyros lotus TaxID=55363 RepID=UPI0022504872|nr:uncharacterized protein LOC127786802 [Diospyros lotus]